MSKKPNDIWVFSNESNFSEGESYDCNATLRTFRSKNMWAKNKIKAWFYLFYRINAYGNVSMRMIGTSRISYLYSVKRKTAFWSGQDSVLPATKQRFDRDKTMLSEGEDTTLSPTQKLTNSKTQKLKMECFNPLSSLWGWHILRLVFDRHTVQHRW